MKGIITGTIYRGREIEIVKRQVDTHDGKRWFAVARIDNGALETAPRIRVLDALVAAKKIIDSTERAD